MRLVGVRARLGARPPLVGHGYATEGARAALVHAFTALNRDRVISLIQPENLPSIRVAERLGQSPGDRVTMMGKEYVVYGVDRANRTIEA